MHRRRLALTAALTTLGLGLAWLLGSDRTVLELERAHPVVLRAYPERLAASATGPGLLAACGWMDEPGRAGATRATLGNLAGTGRAWTDLGFGPGDLAPELPGMASEGKVTLPLHASALLATAERPLLLLHAFEPGILAETSRRRGWLGPLAAEVAASAMSATVLARESASPPVLQVTLALEFADGAAAEAALRRLTEAQGDLGQLGFAAQPGYERIVRRTKLVVIRLDVDAGLARAKLRAR
jgi:hypothetical protein